MGQAFIVLLVALTAVGTVLQGHGWWRRQRVLRTIPTAEIVRIDRGVSLRVMVQGITGMPGMKQRRGNRTRGDLVLTKDRFLLTSRRGTLADLKPGRGRRFTSIRCTGPGRLIIEGDVPRNAGEPGLYRFEIVVERADEWVKLLADFVQEGGQVVSFAT
mgnify:CR=1 FL=1